MELAQRRQLEAFKSSIPSLQVAASFACSVASLSRSPAFQLPGHHHLHDEVLADHQFDWGGLSTCTAALAQCLLTPSPSQNLQESPPSTKSGYAVRLVGAPGVLCGGQGLATALMFICASMCYLAHMSQDGGFESGLLLLELDRLTNQFGKPSAHLAILHCTHTHTHIDTCFGRLAVQFACSCWENLWCASQSSLA